MATEVAIGMLTFVGEPRGVHVHVSILGAGARGQRPLCGTIVMHGDEWESLSALIEIAAAQERIGKSVADATADMEQLREHSKELFRMHDMVFGAVTGLRDQLDAMTTARDELAAILVTRNDYCTKPETCNNPDCKRIAELRAVGVKS